MRKADAEFGQLSLLTIEPGHERGNHWHARKREWFSCISGEVDLELDSFETAERRTIRLTSTDIAFECVEPRVAHKVVNVGHDAAKVLVVISEPYDPRDPDTIPFQVRGRV